MTGALEARGIVAGYDDLEILHGVDVRVLPAEVVAIVGPNGSGKSTLFKALFGLVRPRAGTVELDGQDITDLPPHRRVPLGLGYVPQLDNVFPNLTVRENLEVGAQGRSRAQVEDALARVEGLFPGLRGRARERCGRLSGGQRQMVAMGRVLMAEPKILLLDEPSAGLAPGRVSDVFAQISTVAKAGVSVLLVEQNARRALALADRGYVLDAGRNAYEGTGAQLLGDPNVGRLYLGG